MKPYTVKYNSTEETFDVLGPDGAQVPGVVAVEITVAITLHCMNGGTINLCTHSGRNKVSSAHSFNLTDEQEVKLLSQLEAET